MAGYDGFSKSNNAREAECQGYFPASVLAKKLGVSAVAIKALLTPGEWHHTSSWYNATDYYYLPEAHEKIEELKAYKKEIHVEKWICNVKFLEWSGSRNYPVAKEFKLENIVVEEKGDWFLFYLPDGTIKRKKKFSNGTKVDYISKIK